MNSSAVFPVFLCPLSERECHIVQFTFRDVAENAKNFDRSALCVEFRPDD